MNSNINAQLPWLKEIIQLVSITDPAKDPDDENVMAILGNFTLQGAVHTLATVANLVPSDIRAQLTRATYDLLAMNEVPVGIGTDCNQNIPFNPNDYQWKAPYLRRADLKHDPMIHDGQKLLFEQFKQAKDYSISLLLISGMTDAAEFFRNNKSLFCNKIKEVIIMGGIERADEAIVINSKGYMEPDTAANNAFDMPAAKYLYHALQKHNITTWILTREAAYAAAFPRSIYDEMSATGHPVGIRLKAMQETSIQNLWLRSGMPATTPEEIKLRELPARCDKIWFCDTFCGGEAKELPGHDEIWPYIKSFMLYDPMTLIAAIPRFRNVYYKPQIVEVRGTKHYLIGLTEKDHGIKYPDALRGFIHSQIVSSLDIFSQYFQKTGT